MVSFFFFGLILFFTAKGRAAENYPYKEYSHKQMHSQIFLWLYM